MAQTRTLRRPRSSPLSGPSVGVDGSIIVHKPSPGRPKPLRISSVSDLRSSNPSPDRSGSKSSSSPPEPPPSPRHSVLPSFRFPQATPPRPPRSVLRESLKTDHKDTPITPTPITAAQSTSRSSTRHFASISVSSVPTNNWLTTSTHDEMPHFTRSGLNAPHNALPRSAEDHKRHRSLSSSKPSANLPSFVSLVRDPRAESAQVISTTSTRVGHGGTGSYTTTVDGLADDATTTSFPKHLTSYPLDVNYPEISNGGTRQQMRSLKKNSPLSALRDSEFSTLLPNRQSLSSISGSPNYMNLEFNLVTEGKDTGIIVVSPRSEDPPPTLKKSIRSIIIPSVPVDVDLDTPLSPTFNRCFTEQSIRRFSTRSRTHSVGALGPKRKPSLKHRKSLTSLKVHKRAVSKADSVLLATNPIPSSRHAKNTSFLSFTSDGSDEDRERVAHATEEEFGDYGAQSERTLVHKRSVDTFSIDSDELREAEELIMDILALPTYPIARPGPATAEGPQHTETEVLSMFPATASRASEARAFHPGTTVTPPPTTGLPSPPSPASTLGPVTPRSSPTSTLGSPSIVLPTAQKPSMLRSKSSPDDVPYFFPAVESFELSPHRSPTETRKKPAVRRISTSARLGVRQSLHSPGSPTMDGFPIYARPGAGEGPSGSNSDKDSFSSSGRSVTTVRQPGSKALGILGIDETDAMSFISRTSTMRSSFAQETDETFVTSSSRSTSGSLNKDPGLLGVPDDASLRRNRLKGMKTKALGVLGTFDDKESDHNFSSGNMNPPPHYALPKKEKRGVKKLWKTLTGGSVRGSPEVGQWA